MNRPITIRLLAAANNERGDLFTRLTKDLFFALGYDDLRLDVHKSGRELDIQGEHRLEPRRVVGECKAHATKMGGEELNKFFGVLTRERKKSAPTPVAGYFVSLSGFTETGIEQEIETGDDRVILLNAQEVIEELERSRVVVSSTQAAERAGHAKIDGELQPVFEFRHLTFQEYLAARGYVEEQYPGRDASQSLAQVLEPHFGDERWREMIPLAAVLAGRKSEDLMKRLTAACERRDPDELRQRQPGREPLGNLLHQCIRDEVQVTPPTLRIALRELARAPRERGRDFEAGWVTAVLRGKFGGVFQEVVEHTYLAGGRGFEEYAQTLKQLALHQRFGELDRVSSARTDFAFETTLSGLTYLARLCRWQGAGYTIEIIYLKLDDVRISLERVAARVRTGGHNVPEVDVRRRFARSWRNFKNHYRPLADRCWVFNLTGATPVLIPSALKPPSPKPKRVSQDPRTAKIMKSLRNARKAAVKTARLHRTPIVYLQDGKLVREWP